MQLGDVFTVTWLEYQFKFEHNPTNAVSPTGSSRDAAKNACPTSKQ
jgi:hypothetical protein